MKQDNQTSLSNTILQLTWINAPTSIEPELSITVNSANYLSQYLEDIFNKTNELAKIVDPKLKECIFEPGLIQLFRNGTLLTYDEYNTSIAYFTGNENLKIYLNTRHCGNLVLRVVNEEGEPHCVLKLNYNIHSFEDVVQQIMKQENSKGSSCTPDYIFTDSMLYVHPKLKDLNNVSVQKELEQFSQIQFKKKKSESEIGVTMQMLIQTSFIFFLDLTITVEEAKKLLEIRTGIQAQIQILIYEGHELEDQQTLNSYNMQDGCIISIMKPQEFDSTPVHAYSIQNNIAFADLSETEVETIPKGKSKYENPSKGLNIQGHCVNADCKISKERISLLVPWPNSSFDLIKNAGEVYCPKCLVPIKVLAPVFYLTQWKFYGNKFERNVEVDEIASKLISCDWQTADDPDSYSGFTVVDMPNLQVGIVDWGALLIMIRPLFKKKDQRPKTEWLKFGFGVSLPAIFKISINWDWGQTFD